MKGISAIKSLFQNVSMPSVDISGLFELEGLFTGFMQVGVGLLLIVTLITAMELALGRMPLVSKILGRLRNA